MMILENIRNAGRSIAAAKLRSFLTMLGVIIGVAAVALMIGIGDGVKQSVTSQITNLGTNLLTVVSGTIGTQSGSNRPTGGFNPGALGTSTLTTSDVEKVREISGINAVAAVNIISASVSVAGQVSPSSFVISTTPNYFSIRKDITIDIGRSFSDEEETSAAAVVVIGPNIREALFTSRDPLGATINVRGQAYTVIGVVRKSDQAGASFGASFDDAVYIPFSSGNSLSKSNGQVYRIIAEVADSNNVEATKSEIESVVQANHNGQKDFSVLSQKDLLTTFSSILDILTSFIVAIASISLVVGGIGIMNIMLVSVTERTREIGIRKAIGATFGNILGQFISEAIILSLIGGLLGLAAAYGFGIVVERVAKITPVFKPGTIFLALGVSAAVGIIFGVAPAIKAARKRPIQALKSV